MQIIIAGGGKTGQKLIEYFSVFSNYTIKLIDNNAQKCELISEMFPKINIVWGNATHPGVLKEAQAEKADVFIAVTGHDSLNLLAAKAAKKLNIPKVFLRVVEAEYRELATIMELEDVLDPAESISTQIITRLQGVDIVELLLKVSKDYKMKKISMLDYPHLVQTKVNDLSNNFEGDLHPLFVLRQGKYLLPTDIKNIEEQDSIIAFAKNKKNNILGL